MCFLVSKEINMDLFYKLLINNFFEMLGCIWCLFIFSFWCVKWIYLVLMFYIVD